MMKQIKHEMVLSLWKNRHLPKVFQNNKINQIYLMLVKILESISTIQFGNYLFFLKINIFLLLEAENCINPYTSRTVYITSKFQTQIK